LRRPSLLSASVFLDSLTGIEPIEAEWMTA
jgi:hypothetical protein